MDRTAIIKEKERRLNILGILTTDFMENQLSTQTTYAWFRTDKCIRSIPFYGDWSHMYRFYIFEDNDAFKRVVESLESTGCGVYAAIYNRYKGLGDMLTLLTVSYCESEWEQEREDLKEMQPIAYIHNFTYPEFSEWGSVLLRMNDNVLERIG